MYKLSETFEMNFILQKWNQDQHDWFPIAEFSSIEEGNRKIYWWEKLLAIATVIGFLIALAYFTAYCFG